MEPTNPYRTPDSLRREIRREWIKIVIALIILILAIDALGFMAWAMSGQVPAEGFYIGKLTASFIYLFIHA